MDTDEPIEDDADETEAEDAPSDAPIDAPIDVTPADPPRVTNALALRGTPEKTPPPWDVMLDELRRSSTRAAWIDGRLAAAIALEEAADATDDPVGAILARRDVDAWLAESRKERAHLARVSAAAIRAGIREQLVRHVELEAQTIAWVLGRAIDAADLSPAQQGRAASALASALRDVSLRQAAAYATGVDPATLISPFAPRAGG